MRLPVSRVAYDLALNERDRLREQNDKLVDQLTRLVRRDNGLPEIPPERKRENIVIPAELMREIEAWESPETQTLLKAQAVNLYRETKDWNTVRARMEDE